MHRGCVRVSAPLTTFSVATNECRGGNGERTEYQACVAYPGRLLTGCLHLSKGQLVDVEGRLQTRQWDDDAGKGHLQATGRASEEGRAKPSSHTSSD